MPVATANVVRMHLLCPRLDHRLQTNTEASATCPTSVRLPSELHRTETFAGVTHLPGANRKGNPLCFVISDARSPHMDNCHPSLGGSIISYVCLFVISTPSSCWRTMMPFFAWTTSWYFIGEIFAKIHHQRHEGTKKTFVPSCLWCLCGNSLAATGALAVSKKIRTGNLPTA